LGRRRKEHKKGKPLEVKRGGGGETLVGPKFLNGEGEKEKENS